MNESLSTIGIRLCSWKMYRLQKKCRSGLPKDRQLSSRIDRGKYWNHWVEYVGHGNESILCLIPFTAPTRFAGSSQWNATSYRDLPVWECILVGDIFREFRPQMISAMDTEIVPTILCLKQPQGLYQLEQWSDERIAEQTLSSNFFDEALKRVV